MLEQLSVLTSNIFSFSYSTAGTYMESKIFPGEVVFMTAALFLQIEHKYQMMMKLKMPSFEIFPFVLISFISNCKFLPL